MRVTDIAIVGFGTIGKMHAELLMRRERPTGLAAVLAGTEGSLTLPHLEFWRYKGAKGWYGPISADRAP